MASLSADPDRGKHRLWHSIRAVSWGLVLLICIVSGSGIAVLYSAADGNMEPWAAKQVTRFAIALILMVGAALPDIRYWFRAAYWTYAAMLALELPRVRHARSQIPTPGRAARARRAAPKTKGRRPFRTRRQVHSRR